MNKVIAVIVCVVLIFTALLPVFPADHATAASSTTQWGGYKGSGINPYSDFEGVTEATLRLSGYSFADGALVTDAADAGSGSAYMKVAGGESLAFRVDSEPQTAYLAQGYYKYATGDDATGVQLFMNEHDVNAYINYNNALVYTDTWTKFGIVMMANRTKTGDVSFSLRNGAGRATVYIDDLYFVKLDNYDMRNIVENRSFEFNDTDSDSTPAHHYASWFNNGGMRLVGDAHHGEKALKVTSGNAYSWIHPPEINSEQKRYEFSAWVKWSRGADFAAGQTWLTAPSISLDTYNEANNVVFSKTYSFTVDDGIKNNDWCYINFMLDAESTPADTVSFRLFLNSATGGVIWDEVSIKPVENYVDVVNDYYETEKILDYKQNGTYIARAQLMSGDSAGNGKVYLAEYRRDSDNELMLTGIASSPVKVDGLTHFCVLNGVNTADDSTTILRAFLWDGSMKPVAVNEISEFTVEENLIENGGFEEVVDSAPVGIGVYAGWGGRHGRLVTDEVHSGQYAAQINAGNAATFLEINMSGLFAGTEYRFACWYKGEVAPGLGMNVRVRQRADSDSGVSLIRDYWCTPVYSADSWTLYMTTFTLVEGTSIIIYPTLRSMQASTVVYIDDISLVPTENAPVADLVTDNVFYYSDTTGNGKATVKLSPHYADKGYTADICLADGDDIIKESTDLSFGEDNKAEFTYDLSLLAIKTKEYRIIAEIKDTSGNTVCTEVQQVYKYDRPSTVSKDGTFTDINGKRIDPMFMYHIPYEDIASAASAGINVMQYAPAATVEETLAQLDEMYEMGVYAGVVCYWGMSPAGSAVNYERVKAFIEQIKHHPAIFCYMVMDEPFINNPNAHDDLRKSYIMLRGVDPDRPTYICEGFPAYMEEVAKYTDIMAPDIYPGAGQSMSTFVADMVEYAHKYVNYDKPLLTILQAFSYSGAKPTALQLHSMMYQSLLAGGNALGYYTWLPDNPAVDKNIDEDFYWPMLQTFYAEEKTIVYDYYAYGKGETFNYDKGDSGIWYESWYDESGEYIYLVVQNRDLLAGTDAVVPLVSQDGKTTVADYTAEVVGNGEDSAIKNSSAGEITVSLEATQAMLIKITLQ